jgi:hypothetical protein
LIRSNEEVKLHAVYTPDHRLHDPETEVQFGIPLPMYEVPPVEE